MYKNFTVSYCRKKTKCFSPCLAILKTTLLVTVVFLNSAVASHGQTVSLSVKNAPVTNVLYQLSKQSGYDFIYDSKLLAKMPSLTLDVHNASLKNVLNTHLNGQSLDFIFNEDQTIVIKEKESHSSKPVVKQEFIVG